MIELTILMPCLNEAETLAVCVQKANRFLAEHGVAGEVLIADNGSSDGSIDIATSEGARVVQVKQRGYGAALRAGVDAALGRYVIMGDADDSYDFSALMPFLASLRDGNDLVMGNRFRGGIAPGAMPFLHKYLGNPVLSFLGRLFFSIRIGDFHCGLRGFNRARMCSLDLRTTGMEFASEMVVCGALNNFTITEVPTTLRKDGRSRPPHLRTWRDGWRHLSFLLIYSPRWLFLFPGISLLALGILATALLLPGAVFISNIRFDIHTFVVACISWLLGIQALSFGIIARRVAILRGWLPPAKRSPIALERLSLEKMLLVALVPLALGIVGLLLCVATWAKTGFGMLEYAALVRLLLVSMTSLAVGVQLGFTAFLAAVMEVPSKT